MAAPHQTDTLSVVASVLGCATEVQQPSRLQRSEDQGLPSDEADRIAVRVMGRLAGQLLRLRILVRHDGFVLQGRVRSYYAKQLVQEAVRKATDMRIAENAVEVV